MKIAILQKAAVWIALVLVVATVPLLASLSAHAGTITAAGTIDGPGLGLGVVPAIITLSEANDNQPGGPGFDGNQVVAIKRFDFNGYIDIEFIVRDSIPAGTSEYRFFEAVDNNTGIDWIGYTIQLGFGVGAGFVPPPAGLDFDAPDFDVTPTSTAFASVAWGEDLLVFSNGIHSSGAEIYEFRIDVPDGIQSFTLRQTPIPIPEPSTLALSVCALGGMGLFLRRKRLR